MIWLIISTIYMLGVFTTFRYTGHAALNTRSFCPRANPGCSPGLCSICRYDKYDHDDSYYGVTKGHKFTYGTGSCKHTKPLGILAFFGTLFGWPFIAGYYGINQVYTGVFNRHLGYFKPAPHIESKDEKIARLEREQLEQVKQIEQYKAETDERLAALGIEA